MLIRDYRTSKPKAGIKHGTSLPGFTKTGRQDHRHNTQHLLPPAFMRDVTHCNAWCYDELGGFLELAGLKVITIHRLYHDSIIKRLVRRYLFYPVFRIMNFDYARQIIVVAQKPQ